MGRRDSLLARGYTPGIRYLEITSILLLAALWVTAAWRLSEAPARHAGWIWWSIPASYLFADLVSGIVHWLADTWGNTEMPVIGRALIRPFREHHVDPKAITHHDFVETNGNNCLICLPVALTSVTLPLEQGIWIGTSAFLAGLIFWVFLTNQFHKWAHTGQPPWWVGFLQRARVILPRDHHEVHHGAPHLANYCITTGWMNPVLDRLKIFRGIERIVTAITGVEPRADDLRRP